MRKSDEQLCSELELKALFSDVNHLGFLAIIYDQEFGVCYPKLYHAKSVLRVQSERYVVCAIISRQGDIQNERLLAHKVVQYVLYTNKKLDVSQFPHLKKWVKAGRLIG